MKYRIELLNQIQSELAPAPGVGPTQLKKDGAVVMQLALLYGERWGHEKAIREARHGLADLEKATKAHNAKCAKPSKKKKKCAGGGIIGSVNCVTNKMDQQ